MDDEPGFGDWEEDPVAEETEAPAEEAAEEAVAAVADGGEEEDPWGAVEEGEEVEGEEGEHAPHEDQGEPQEPERKLFWSKWERPKSHIYDYNYGYFNNYYSGVLDSLNERNNSHTYYPIKPLAENWAERSNRMYKEMDVRRKKGQIHDDVELLHSIHKSSISYWIHQKEFSKKYSGYTQHEY